MDTSLNPCQSKRFFILWIIFHLEAIFGFVGALESIWCFYQIQIMRFSWFWDETVDRLDVVASNLEQRRTGGPVGWWVFRLDTIASSYCTKGKRSTGLTEWSSNWMQ